MKTAVLMACALLLIIAGLCLLTTRPDSVAAQEVKIEPGRKPTPKPATPASKPRKPIVSRAPRRVGPEIAVVLVPGGSFLMGSPENEPDRIQYEGPQHRVTVPNFYIGKYEVTQAQWRAVMGANPSGFKGDNLPVENVSWNDAKEFCGRLSQMTGKKYRLPTEAEWEYACRAKTTGAYAGDLDAMAWYRKNSDGKTHPVGQKQPNAFGLYDMHGNVAEWCEDFWHNDYNGAPTDGSAWLSGGDSNLRALRSGSWFNDGGSCRSAFHGRRPPGDRNEIIGFRVVVSARK